MSKDALAKQARRSSPDLAGSHASLPSISDLGDEYLQAGGPRTPSLASTDDQLEDRDRPSRLSGPPSPSQQLTRSFASDGPSALDAAHPSTSRHSSSVTFGPTTATYFSQQPPNDSEEPLSRPDVARGRLPTDETGLLSDAQQPHRAAYGSTLSTSRLDRAAATDRAESPSPSPHASLRSPGTHRIRKKLAKTASFVGLRRAQSYDEGLGAGTTDVNVVSNGTRHWTASFSSVDWVHDSVKDASRAANIRNLARRNWRWKAFLLWDRLQGWVVVTSIGVLTALVAFAIVRGEGWLFDLKDGYCAKPNGGWRLSRGFCCSGVEGTLPEYGPHSLAAPVFSPAFAAFSESALVNAESCHDWRSWESVLGPLLESKDDSSWARWIPFERYMIEYIVYTLVAVALATFSSYLTIALTRSTDFETRREVALQAKTDGGAADPPEQRPRKVMFFAAGSGIPEIKTILSGFVIHGYLGGRTLFTKSVGLTLSVAAGLSLGKEGPMVHIASCIGNICSRLFLKYETNEGKRREILSAACAAGVAVAFGAPVGGVLFSLEEVSYFFPPKAMWRALFCSTVAVTCLKALDPFGTGKIVLFQVSYDTDWRFAELIVFVVIGAGMGLYGALFARLNMLWSRHVRGGTWLKTNPIKEVALVTLVTAILSFVNPLTHMAGGELVLLLVSECDPDRPSHLCVSKPSEIRSAIWAIAVAMVLKGLLTVITFGIKLPAGVFVPTLAVGACFGRIVGLVLQDLQSAKTGTLISSLGFHSSKIEPGVYAMVGAAAALAGVTRTTVSLAVIIMELTGSLTYAVPVILGVLVAKTVADALEPKGIYDLVIELNQIPFLDAKETHRWGQLQISDVLDAQAPIIRSDRDNSVASLTTLAANFNAAVGPDGGFPVLERSAGGLRLRGVLALNELEHVLANLQDQPNATCILRPRPQAQSRASFYANLSPFSADVTVAPGRDPLDLSAYMDQAPLTIQLHSPLELVQQLFVKLGVRSLICLNEQGHYVGMISKARWLAFLDELHEQ